MASILFEMIIRNYLNRIRALKTPGIEASKTEILSWIVLCVILTTLISTGDSNGIGVFQQPDQNLIAPLVIGCIVNGLIIYFLGIRIIPYYYLRNQYFRFIFVWVFLLIISILFKAVLDYILIYLFYADLRSYSFAILLEENLYFALVVYLLSLPYGIYKVLIYRSHLSPDEDMIIQSGKKIYRYKKADIDYFEAQGNYVKVVGRLKSELLYTTLSKLERQMDTRYFRRVHRSYIISIKNARRMDTKHIVFENIEIPIGVKYLKEIKIILAEKRT